jgi:hypothetical protein
VVLGVERAVLGLDNGPLVRHLARRILNVLVREVRVVPRSDSAKPAACNVGQKSMKMRGEVSVVPHNNAAKLAACSVVQKKMKQYA